MNKDNWIIYMARNTKVARIAADRTRCMRFGEEFSARCGLMLTHAHKRKTRKLELVARSFKIYDLKLQLVRQIDVLFNQGAQTAPRLLWRRDISIEPEVFPVYNPSITSV